MTFSHPEYMLCFRAMPELTPDVTPQFETAEYSGTPGSEYCKVCKQPSGLRYYRINSAMLCPGCAEQVQSSIPSSSPSTYSRALLFGAGAAVLGLIIYAAFGIMTGLEIGYLSLAVGYLVGKAMMKGSNGVGGRRYQIAAVLLTYAAVSMAAVPIAISQVSKEKKAKAEQSQVQNSAGEQPTGENNPSNRTMNPAAALGFLALLGLASPFYELAADPFHGLIGVVILFVGMRIAWRLTAGSTIEVLGPFDNTVSSPT
jgi:hypothetical protein